MQGPQKDQGGSTPLDKQRLIRFLCNCCGSWYATTIQHRVTNKYTDGAEFGNFARSRVALSAKFSALGRVAYTAPMTSELLLRRKWTLRAHGQQVVFIKKPIEHAHHVLMKAFLWALYLPDYPSLKVEINIGDRYKPDVVALPPTEPHGAPLFWGEAGQVSPAKIQSLARRYRQTHLAIAKWGANLRTVEELVTDALTGIEHQAHFDLLCFPTDSADRFIDERGNITLHHTDLIWKRLTS